MVTVAVVLLWTAVARMSEGSFKIHIFDNQDRRATRSNNPVVTLVVEDIELLSGA